MRRFSDLFTEKEPYGFLCRPIGKSRASQLTQEMRSEHERNTAMKKSNVTLIIAIAGSMMLITISILCLRNAQKKHLYTIVDLTTGTLSDAYTESDVIPSVSSVTDDKTTVSTVYPDEKVLDHTNTSVADPAPVQPAGADPTPIPSTKPADTQEMTETIKVTDTPKVTSTPMPTDMPLSTNTPVPTVTPTTTQIPSPTPTQIPSPSPTEVPEKAPVPAVIRVTYTVSGCNITSGFGTAWEDGDFVQVNVTREYICQPLDGTEYHSYSVSDYEPCGLQVDPDDLYSDFYAVYPYSYVWGYGTGYVDGHLVGPKVVGFVE